MHWNSALLCLASCAETLYKSEDVGITVLISALWYRFYKQYNIGIFVIKTSVRYRVVASEFRNSVYTEILCAGFYTHPLDFFICFWVFTHGLLERIKQIVLNSTFQFYEYWYYNQQCQILSRMLGGISIQSRYAAYWGNLSFTQA